MRIATREWGSGIVAKVNVHQVLAKELPRKKGMIGLGTVTDPYQPVENELNLTRRCLEAIADAGGKVSVLTKSDLVVRDIDVIRRIPQAEVGLTVNTSSDERAQVFEACAPPPSRRLAAIRALADAGINVYVFLGPVIPTITDHDLEGLVNAIAASEARSVMVDRLNLRPGMKERMVRTMSERSPATLGEFEAKVDLDTFYSNVISRLRDMLRGRGLQVADAF
jgi:DNA repair photolyase